MLSAANQDISRRLVVANAKVSQLQVRGAPGGEGGWGLGGWEGGEVAAGEGAGGTGEGGGG
jgi:hypothetical protein